MDARCISNNSKSIRQMINLKIFLEHRTTDEIKIYFGSKEIFPSKYAYDKESLDLFIDFYKKYENELSHQEIRLCKLNGNKWKVLKNICLFDFIKINNEFLTFGNKYYSYNELVDLLNTNKYILILYNANNS